jgi:hypothetical protein
MEGPLDPLPARSYLFVPEDRPGFLEKAQRRAADAIRTLLKSDMVAASIAAEIASPIASASPDFTDLAALEQETTYFRDMGM